MECECDLLFWGQAKTRKVFLLGCHPTLIPLLNKTWDYKEGHINLLIMTQFYKVLLTLVKNDPYSLPQHGLFAKILCQRKNDSIMPSISNIYQQYQMFSNLTFRELERGADCMCWQVSPKVPKLCNTILILSHQFNLQIKKIANK